MPAHVARPAERAENRIVKADRVVVPSGRYRKDMGDLEPLAKSIYEHGLFHPLGVVRDPDEEGKFVLFGGERRFRACTEILKLKEVPVRVFEDVEDALLLEFDENEIRKDFTWSERLAIAKDILAKWGDGRHELGDPDRKRGYRTQIVAEKTGLGSQPTLSRVNKVVENGAPELVRAMDEEKIQPRFAARIADLPKGQQREVVKKVRAGAKAKRAFEEVAGKPIEPGLPLSDASEAEIDLPEEIALDGAGKKIPTRLTDCFNNALIPDLVRLLRAMPKQLKSCAKWNPYLRLPDILAHMNAVIALIDAAKPFAVCPRCKANLEKSESCPQCRCVGWMDENTFVEHQEHSRVQG